MRPLFSPLISPLLPLYAFTTNDIRDAANEKDKALTLIAFFTDAGWDLMEPVTWATGFGALLASCAFLVYHNREVSYSSLLDLSITARQQRLYDEKGLNIEQWTEMGKLPSLVPMFISFTITPSLPPTPDDGTEMLWGDEDRTGTRLT